MSESQELPGTQAGHVSTARESPAAGKMYIEVYPNPCAPNKTFPLTPTSHITITSFPQTPHQVLATLTDPNHALNSVWPAFIGKGSSVSNEYFAKLFTDAQFLPWQLAATVHTNTNRTNHTNGDIGDSHDSAADPELRLIALGISIPFYWANTGDSSTLPDRGWDEVLRLGNSLTLGSPRPNTLSALAISVDPEYRATVLRDAQGNCIDLAQEMISSLRDLAKMAGFAAMVVPLRPTRKGTGGNVWVGMEKYVRARRGEDPPLLLQREVKGEDDLGEGEEKGQGEIRNDDPYDPWLRKHVSLGGKIVKVCHRSCFIEAGVSDWEEWTGVDFSKPSVNPYTDGESGEGTLEGGEGYEVVIPGGLVPVRVFSEMMYLAKDGREEMGVGVYVEPNVWLRHF